MTQMALLIGAMAAGVAAIGGAGPASARAIEGKVVDGRGVPIAGAMILVAPVDPPLPFAEEATARTDLFGRYRIDLGEPSWGTSKLRTLVLAPGFRAEIGKVEASPEAPAVDFALTAETWRTIELSLTDPEGHPAAGVEVDCSVEYQVPWSRFRTDAGGRALVEMAAGQGIVLRAKPDGARPIAVSLRNHRDDDGAVQVSLLAPIRGRVRDAEGRPVAAAVVGRAIRDDRGKITMNRHFGGGSTATTDREGRFELAPVVSIALPKPDRAKPHAVWPISFADEEFGRIAFRATDLSGPVGPLDVTLEPCRPIRIPIARDSAAASRDEIMMITVRLAPRPEMPRNRPIALVKELPRRELPEGDRVVLNLPAGAYEIAIETYDAKGTEVVESAARELVVPAGEGPLDLPELRVEPTLQQAMAGKPAPEIDAADLDTGRPVRLADFRGKVVILDFWGYWCGPCVGAMPRLMELHRRFEGQPVAVIALHDESVQSRAEYDRRIDDVRRDLWGGDLPFRVLLDRPDPAKEPGQDPEGTGLTTRRYGIASFPSLFVIDQQGKMIGQINHRDHKRLDILIRDLLGKPAPR